MLYRTECPVGEILPYGDPPKLIPIEGTRDALNASSRRMVRIGGKSVGLGNGGGATSAMVSELKASIRVLRRIG